MSQATVLSSELHSRNSDSVLAAFAAGSSARIEVRPLSRSRSGPLGSPSAMVGQRVPFASAVIRSPAVPHRTSSAGPRPVTHSSVSPARCSRQSKVSSQVRRRVRALVAGTTREPRRQCFP